MRLICGDLQYSGRPRNVTNTELLLKPVSGMALGRLIRAGTADSGSESSADMVDTLLEADRDETEHLR